MTALDVVRAQRSRNRDRIEQIARAIQRGDWRTAERLDDIHYGQTGRRVWTVDLVAELRGNR